MTIKCWLKDINRWINEDECPLNIHPRKLAKEFSCHKIRHKRYYVGESHPGVYLTRRELDISILLVQGKRCKEIGRDLLLSPRSIEYYILNMRLKFNCSKKKILIEM